MPKRTDIHRVLVIGSGPIVIGQACEFDYSGTQACKALRSEGLEVVLVNSNPATIMTDPELADRTYVEPLTPEVVEAIIAKERPDALLPTVGGQTALNLAVALAERGTLEKYGVTLIGASIPAIKVAEDRLLFRNAMQEIGIDVPRSALAGSLSAALDVVAEIGFPAIIRPSFTLGGVGGGIAYNIEEYREIVQRGIGMSPVHEVLIEESVIGWKEFELEVMRDGADNFVVICSIENIDPMGVHTGDSITVAPALTLTDREYQRMRDAARRIIRRVGCRDRWQQHPVRDQPGHGPHDHDRDEPARVAVLRAGLEGHGVPDCEDRGEARARLPPRRDPQRHHPGDARLVRADDRLHRREDPALGVREVPPGRPDADDADEVGRRGDGHRPHVQAGVPQGHPLAGTRRAAGALFGQPIDDEAAEAPRCDADLVIPNARRMWAVFRALEHGWTVEQIQSSRGWTRGS